MPDRQLLALKAVAVWLASPTTVFPTETAHQVLDVRADLRRLTDADARRCAD